MLHLEEIMRKTQQHKHVVVIPVTSWLVQSKGQDIRWITIHKNGKRI